jgi:hypothetical protein
VRYHELSLGWLFNWGQKENLLLTTNQLAKAYSIREGQVVYDPRYGYHSKYCSSFPES